MELRGDECECFVKGIVMVSRSRTLGEGVGSEVGAKAESDKLSTSKLFDRG